MTAQAEGAVLLRLRWEGACFLTDGEVSIRLDGRAVGKGSCIRGIDLSVATAIGPHVLELSLLGGLRSRAYKLDLQLPGTYEAVLSYSRLWGNFRKRIDLRHMGPAGPPPPEPPVVLEPAAPEPLAGEDSAR